jgi:hypothetical protein
MRTKNNEKMGRLLVLTACVWLPVLASCDRLGDGNDEGVKTAVHFSSGDLEPWGAETVIRGASTSPRLVETASVALEGRWVLEADLMEESVPPTRAYLNTGATVRVVALDASKAAVVAEKDYRQLSGALLEPVAGAMELEPGNYHFTAYSYNNVSVAAPTSATTEVTVSPYVDGSATNDLISGTTPDLSPKAVTAGGGVDLPNLSHRFSRVQYSTNIPAGAPVVVNSVSLTNNCRATLTKSTALPAKRTEYDVQSLSAAGHCIVYTGGENPKLSISVTVNGTETFPSVLLSYRQPLTAGKSYTLRINIKRNPAWAASNIYWDGSKLTFKEHGDPCVNHENYYQGVYFKWGSLVGISPKGEYFVDAGPTPIYVYHGGQWRATSLTAAYNTDPSLCYPGFESAEYTGIPYVTTGTGLRTEDNLGDWFPDFPDNKGDICRYIGERGGPSGYRMPKSSEFEVGGDHSVVRVTYSWTAAATIGWVNGGFPSTEVISNDATGRQLFGYPNSSTGGYATNAGSTFPASGSRVHNLTARALQVGTIAIYYSSSANDEMFAHYIYMTYIGVYIDDLFIRNIACPVRCLLDE